MPQAPAKNKDNNPIKNKKNFSLLVRNEDTMVSKQLSPYRRLAQEEKRRQLKQEKRAARRHRK